MAAKLKFVVSGVPSYMNARCFPGVNFSCIPYLTLLIINQAVFIVPVPRYDAVQAFALLTYCKSSPA